MVFALTSWGFKMEIWEGLSHRQKWRFAYLLRLEIGVVMKSCVKNPNLATLIGRFILIASSLSNQFLILPFVFYILKIQLQL